MRSVVLVAFLSAGGCASGPHARAGNGEACAIGLLAAGANPQRPYRVLGKVDAVEGSVPDRYRAVQQKGCALGADAVIDVRNVLLPNGNNFGNVESNKTWAGDDEGRPATVGVAVAFTDGKAPPGTSPQYFFPKN